MRWTRCCCRTASGIPQPRQAGPAPPQQAKQSQFGVNNRLSDSSRKNTPTGIKSSNPVNKEKSNLQGKRSPNGSLKSVAAGAGRARQSRQPSNAALMKAETRETVKSKPAAEEIERSPATRDLALTSLTILLRCSKGGKLVKAPCEDALWLISTEH